MNKYKVTVSVKLIVDAPDKNTAIDTALEEVNEALDGFLTECRQFGEADYLDARDITRPAGPKAEESAEAGQ